MASLAQNDRPAATKTWWTAREIADHYGLSVRSVYDAIATGVLVVHRFGQGRGGIRISDADRLVWELTCRKSTVRQPAASFKTRPLITTSPLVAKHFGQRLSARRPSCGRGSAADADTRG